MSPRGDDEKVAPTADYTAEAWARLGVPRGALFRTPRGRALHVGYDLLERLRGREGGRGVLLRTLAHRHAVLDELAVAHEADLLVELGAGFTPRSVHFALDLGIPALDVDLPHVLAERARRLARALPDAERARLALSLRARSLDVRADGFGDALAGALGDAQRPVLVAEGLVGYFDPEGKQRLLGGVAHALRGRAGGLFLSDVRVDGPSVRAGMGTLLVGIRILTRGRGASPPFADEADVVATYRRAGFRAVEVLPPRPGCEDVLSRIVRATL